MNKVLVTTQIQPVALGVLRENFQDVVVASALSMYELLKLVSQVEILIVRSETKVTREVIERASNLKIIGRAGMGLDNIDLIEAQKRGIKILSTPDGNSVSVAELVFALMLTFCRKIREADEGMKSSKWLKSQLTGYELCNKILGIVGLGRIGKIVARLGQSFGMKVVAYDFFVSPEDFQNLGVKSYSDLKEMLSVSDFVTVHVPKTVETTNLIDEGELAVMKPNVLLINCARGEVVNELALYQALVQNRIAGAAIDTWEKEPEFNKDLANLPNVIALPHLGASTYEAQNRCMMDLIKQIIFALKTPPKVLID